jgi:hypothetical protein
MSSPFILFAQRGHSHKIKGEAMKEKDGLKPTLQPISHADSVNKKHANKKSVVM